MRASKRFTRKLYVLWVLIGLIGVSQIGCPAVTSSDSNPQTNNQQDKSGPSSGDFTLNISPDEAGPDAPPVAYVAPPLNSEKVYVQANENGLAVVVGLKAADPIVETVTVYNPSSGDQKTFDVYGSSFRGVIQAQVGDVVQLWTDCTACLPGGININHIDEKVMSWRSLPGVEVTMTSTSYGLFLTGREPGQGSRDVLYFIPKDQLENTPGETKIQKFTTEDYLLLPDSIVPKSSIIFIKNILEDRRGQIWFSAYGDLIRMTFNEKGEAQFARLTRENGIQDEILIGPVYDSTQDLLWTVGKDGLFRCPFDINQLPVCTRISGIDLNFDNMWGVPAPDHAGGLIFSRFEWDYIMYNGIQVRLDTYKTRLGKLRFDPADLPIVSYFDVNDGWPERDVISLQSSPDGSVWIQADKLYNLRITANETVAQAYFPDAPLDQISIDSMGEVWGHDSQSVFQLSFEGSSATVRKTYPVSDLPYVVGGVRQVEAGFDGRVWFSDQFNITRIQTLETEPDYRQYEVLPGDWIWDIQSAYDADGSWTGNWIATVAGLTLQTMNRKGGVTFENFFLGNYVTSVAPDSSGAWVGFFQGGLRRINRAGSSHSIMNTNIPLQATVDCLVSGSDGTVWVGSYAGLFHVAAEGYILREFNTTNSNLPSDLIYSIKMDPYGTLWVGTALGLAELVDPESSEPFKIHLTAMQIYSLTADENRVYAGTTALHSLDLNDPAATWKSYDVTNSTWHVLSIAILSDESFLLSIGNYYNLGNGIGLVQLEYDTDDNWNRISTYSVEDGLTSNWIMSLAPHPDGGFFYGGDKGVGLVLPEPFCTWSYACATY